MKKIKEIGITAGIVVLFFTIIFSFMISNPIQNLDELWNYSLSKNISDGLVPYKDFNLVQTPFLFMVAAIFLKFIFNGIIMTRILGAILATAILVMIYIILNKLIVNSNNTKNTKINKEQINASITNNRINNSRQNSDIQNYNKYKYINLLITLIIGIIMLPFFTLDYNFLVLLFALIILNYELKSKDENLLKLNIKKDFLIGILAGIAIITKQSTGLLVAVAYVGYKWLAIRSKEDFVLAFKISLSRGLGVLAPIMIFLGSLFITNSFNDFFSFCVLGVSEFSNSIPYTSLLTESYYAIHIKILAVIVPLTILYTIFYLVRNYKLNTLESKNILKLFVFGLVSFIVVFPISDDIHFLIGSMIFIILSIYIIVTHLEIKKDETRESLNKLTIYMVYIVLVMLVVVMCFNYYGYFTNKEKNHNLNYYQGIIVNEGLVKMITGVNEYSKEQEENGNKVYIVNADAVCYNIPVNKYNKYFDLLLKGNLGPNGTEAVIEKIKSLDENSMILILNENYSLNWQTPLEVIQYVRDNYNKIDEVQAFDVYSKNGQ